MTFRIVTSVQVRHVPALRPFRLRRRLDQLARVARGSALHRCSFLSHCLPFLIHSISRPFLIRTQQMRVLSPSPTPFKFRGTRSFPLTPSSHGCEGVSGKLGGAVRAAAEAGWARADGRELSDNGCLNALRIAPGKRPENAPDPGACCGAHSRAYWRAISRAKRAVPQSIAGGDFSAFQGLKQCAELFGQPVALGGLTWGSRSWEPRAGSGWPRAPAVPGCSRTAPTRRPEPSPRSGKRTRRTGGRSRTARARPPPPRSPAPAHQAHGIHLEGERGRAPRLRGLRVEDERTPEGKIETLQARGVLREAGTRDPSRGGGSW